MNETPSIPTSALKGKTVLVTGASGGIGSAVAKALAQQQAEVILLGRNVKLLEPLYDALSAVGPEPAIFVTDLLKFGIKDAQDLYDYINSLFGKLDGLIHCAGHWGTFTPIEHYPEKQWLEIMHLNVNAPFLVTKALLPLLLKSKTGTLLFTESDLSQTTKAFHGPLNASQYALHALIEVLQKEYSHTSLKIAGVNPKAVRTKLRAKLYPGLTDLGLCPEEVVPLYLDLLSSVVNH